MAAAFKNFLINVIGFANDADAQRVREVGMDSFATMPEYNKDDVKSLCRTLRKDANAPIEIGPIVEKRLYQAVCLATHYDLMNRPLNSTNLSRACLSHHGTKDVLQTIFSNLWTQKTELHTLDL